MTLGKSVVPERTHYGGESLETATAGQEFKIELPQNDVLKATVPRGKVWEINIHVDIEERDA